MDLISKYLNEATVPQPTVKPPPEPHPLPSKNNTSSILKKENKMLESKYFRDSRDHEPAVNEKTLNTIVPESVKEEKKKEIIFHESDDASPQNIPEEEEQKPNERCIIDLTEEEEEIDNVVDLDFMRSKLLKDCDEMENIVKQLGVSIGQRLSKIRALEMDTRTKILGSEKPRYEQRHFPVDAILKEDNTTFIPEERKPRSSSAPRLPNVDVDALLNEINTTETLMENTEKNTQHNIHSKFRNARDEIVGQKEDDIEIGRSDRVRLSPVLRKLPNTKNRYSLEQLNAQLTKNTRYETNPKRTLNFEKFSRNVRRFGKEGEKFRQKRLTEAEKPMDFDHLKYSSSLRAETSKALEQFKEALLAIDKNLGEK